MKAIEYVEKYHDYLLSPPLDLWKDAEASKGCKLDALIAICRDLFFEVKKIMASRNATTDAALLSVLKEQDQKYQAFCRRVNDSLIMPHGFRAFIANQTPEVATILNWS